MATSTTNYGLRKPATTDYVNVQTDLNANYDIIDSAMKDISDDVVQNAADIATNAGDIATNAGDIATNAGNIAQNAQDIGTINAALSGLIKSVTIPDTTLTSTSYFLNTTLSLNTTAPINFYCTSGRRGWFYQFMENVNNNGYWAVAPLTKDNTRPDNLIFGGVLYYIDLSVL